MVNHRLLVFPLLTSIEQHCKTNYCRRTAPPVTEDVLGGVQSKPNRRGGKMQFVWMQEAEIGRKWCTEFNWFHLEILVCSANSFFSGWKNSQIKDSRIWELLFLIQSHASLTIKLSRVFITVYFWVLHPEFCDLYPLYLQRSPPY